MATALVRPTDFANQRLPAVGVDSGVPTTEWIRANAQKRASSAWILLGFWAWVAAQSGDVTVWGFLPVSAGVAGRLRTARSVKRAMFWAGMALLAIAIGIVAVDPAGVDVSFTPFAGLAGVALIVLSYIVSGAIAYTGVSLRLVDGRDGDRLVAIEGADAAFVSAVATAGLAGG